MTPEGTEALALSPYKDLIEVEVGEMVVVGSAVGKTMLADATGSVTAGPGVELEVIKVGSTLAVGVVLPEFSGGTL